MFFTQWTTSESLICANLREKNNSRTVLPCKYPVGKIVEKESVGVYF